MFILGLCQTPLMASDLVCHKECLIMHPQQSYCDVDTVYEIVFHAHSINAVYEARVLRRYKDSYNFAMVGDPVVFYSPNANCNIPDLKPSEIYVIGGKFIDNRLFVSSCDGIAFKFDNLTEHQRKGFKNGYRQQCDFCTRYGGEDCETLYSFCKPRPDTGVCEWEGTVDYDDCFTNREGIWVAKEKSQPAFTCRSQCASQDIKLLRWKCFRATKKLERQGYARC
nr:uncharacterized protein LOC129255459 [Lytechinus pictus]